MRRHGWALYLGLLAGPAMAQSPVDSERYPPPPELPGVVVGQMRGVTTAVASQKPVPGVLSTTATSAVAPVETGLPLDLPAASLPAPPAAVPPAPGCPAPAPASKCGAGIGSISDWLTFKSRARQSGHFVPPYRPPLLAWFPCEPRWPHYGPAVMPGCAAPCGVPIGPAPTIADAPGSMSPPAAIRLPSCPDKEALTSFEKINDGLGFVPGGAPMAGPTTQVKPSTWRPR
jgi:hypothetical protein